MIIFAVRFTTFRIHRRFGEAHLGRVSYALVVHGRGRRGFVLVDFLFERMQCFDAVECGRLHECDPQRRHASLPLGVYPGSNCGSANAEALYSAWQRKLKNTSGAFDIPETLSFMHQYLAKSIPMGLGITLRKRTGRRGPSSH